MKRLLLLFCIIFAFGNVGSAWSEGGKKPKKFPPTVLVKKAKTPPVKPAVSSVAVLSDTRKTVTRTEMEASSPTPWRTIAAEQSPVTVVIISPTTPMAISPPTNPYLTDVPDAPKPAPVTRGNPYLQPAIYANQVPAPPTRMFGASPFENLKTAAFLILPDGIGQMHPPLYIKYIKQPRTAYSQNEKPILLFEVSCPTKAIFGFDTPIVYAVQLGVDQVIALANATDILPIELQKVCN